MAGPCDLPLVGRGCDTVTGAVGGAVSDAAGQAAGGVFDAAAERLADGFATAIQLMVTFWTDVDVPGLSTSSGPVAELRANTAWLSAFVAVLSVLVCAARLAVTRSSRPAGEAFKGLLILVVASGSGVAAVNALVVFGDAYSGWVLDRSTDGQLGQRLAALSTVGDAAGLGAGLILVVALLGMFASVAQIGLMLVRVGVVTILAGLLPLAAAGTGTQTGMEFFKRVVAWLLAFVAYKPAAATVYASAFLLIGDGKDATSVLSGLFLLILSIVALPALLRLVTPVVGAAVAAGAGAGGGLAAAGMVLATGARMSAGSQAGPPIAGGGQQPGLRPTGAATSGAGAAGGGAAGAAQTGVQAAQAAAQAARGAAAHTADLGGTAPAAPATPGRPAPGAAR
jgi:type IV secretion system protein TrbL